MYRLRDIEEWLVEEGVKAKISRGRTTNMPLRHVTLIPTPGRGLETEAAIAVAGLQVISRDETFDKTEELAQQIDMILVPVEMHAYPILIGPDERRTRILTATRAGGEPALLELQNAYAVFSANYLLTATRQSRPLSQVPSASSGGGP